MLLLRSAKTKPLPDMQWQEYRREFTGGSLWRVKLWRGKARVKLGSVKQEPKQFGERGKL